MTGGRRWIVDALSLLGALALMLIALWPLLGSGFMGDDLLNSYLYSRAAYEIRGTTLWSDIMDSISVWAKVGRFNPLANYILVLYYLVNRNVVLYKAILIAVNIATVGLAAWLAKRVSGSNAAGLLVLLITPALFQFRVFEDPILSYAGHAQVALIWTLLSLLALLSYLDTRKRRYLAVSLATFACGALTYEVVVPLVLLHFAVIWLYPMRRRLGEWFKIAWPYAALIALDVSFVVLLRLRGGTPLAGDAAADYVPNLDPAALVSTYAKQTTAALPLIYRLTSGGILLDGVRNEILSSPVLSATLVALAVALVAAVLWRARESATAPASPGGLSLLALLGLGLFLLPGLLTTLSPRYQGALDWGVGYLPVYISYIGVAVMLTAAALALVRSARSASARLVVIVVAAALLAGVSLVNHFDNRMILRQMQAHWVDPLEILESAAARGLFEHVPDGASLYTGNPDVRYSPQGLYAVVGGARVGLTPSPSMAAPLDKDGWREATDPSIWYSGRGASAPGQGYAFVGRILHADVDAKQVTVEDLRVYVQDHSDEHVSAVFELLGIDPSRMRVVSKDDGWALYEVQPGHTALLMTP